MLLELFSIIMFSNGRRPQTKYIVGKLKNKFVSRWRGEVFLLT